MFMEIGSIYEINPELLADAEKEAALCRQEFTLKEVEKYQKKYTAYTASGREAIALVLKSFEELYPQAGKSCLLPAYMCDTVFFPFTSAGWELSFYEIGKNMEADREKLSRQIEEIRPSLLLIHAYYGVDTWKPMRSLLRTWKKQGVRIIEDVTQSYYLRGAGKEADYVVGSLRKWYPIPDGGFVASGEKLSKLAEVLTVNKEYTEKRTGFLVNKWEYLHQTGAARGKTAKQLAAFKADYLRKNRETEDWMDDHAKEADGKISAMSEISKSILKKLENEDYRQRRNENYRYLYERLGRFEAGGAWKLCGLFANGTGEEAPLYFPVYAGNRDELQEYLRKLDIYAPVLWPVGEENAHFLTEDERYIYEHLLALPMDQRYGRAEMERMAAALESYARGRKREEVIGIRADANDIIATGHIMRCITIAKELKKRGRKVIFFTADTYAHEMLREADMAAVCLNSVWNQMERETELLKEELKRAGCNTLLVDSYQATERYFEHLTDAVKLIVIDDCFDAVYPVDMVINYNAFYTRFPYEEAYRRKGADLGKSIRLLLGTEYVPLREEFCRERSERERTDETGISAEEKGGGKKHVLLASGGGDAYDALFGILTVCHKAENQGGGAVGRKADKILDSVIFHVVVGEFHKRKDELLALAQKYPNIKVHVNVRQMAELMSRCDAAVSAAGTMLFELCAVQVPTVFFVSADNQRYDSEFFAAEERMLFAGDIRTDRDACLERICSLLKKLLADEAMRNRMKKKLHQVTDGKGAGRIAEEIIDMSKGV